MINCLVRLEGRLHCSLALESLQARQISICRRRMPSTRLIAHPKRLHLPCSAPLQLWPRVAWSPLWACSWDDVEAKVRLPVLLGAVCFGTCNLFGQLALGHVTSVDEVLF